jgi:hypothetical protein
MTSPPKKMIPPPTHVDKGTFWKLNSAFPIMLTEAKTATYTPNNIEKVTSGPINFNNSTLIHLEAHSGPLKRFRTSPYDPKIRKPGTMKHKPFDFSPSRIKAFPTTSKIADTDRMNQKVAS